MSRAEDGRRGEELAAAYMEKHGYKILSRNYRSRYGELDIVAQDGEYVVFAEVKYRKDDSFATAASAVNYSKRGKLRKTASIWLAENNCESPARFDIVEMYSDGRLNHIRHAFR